MKWVLVKDLNDIKYVIFWDLAERCAQVRASYLMGDRSRASIDHTTVCESVKRLDNFIKDLPEIQALHQSIKINAAMFEAKDPTADDS